MQLQFSENISLKPYNTFGFEVKAKYLIEINQVDQLKALIKSELWIENKHLILGGGSNILLQRNFDGLIVLNKLLGINVLQQDDSSLIVRAGGGENWHEFVQYCIAKNWGGVENLSLIPGTVGAAPMQNIGAYGVEIKDVFHSLEAFNLKSGEVETFTADDCKFGYRESVFKHELKDQYLIVAVQFKLSKPNAHQLKLDYGIIKQTLAEKNITEPSIQDISEAVIQIRQSKLPDPKQIGNSGSFFKNPIINKQQFEELLKEYPSLPAYRISDEEMKVAAGWLIEQAGWKGYDENGVGVHDKQALVLVNKGNGSGEAIAELARKIQDSVYSKFRIQLNPEVNFVI
ncbi:UDP-N-acetylmuramate dehydrogenase [Marivirga atlantica]|jgi:UDP-N-acetylmuramate dehydrogenase|uniref:UDP-N-acetylenolpyruvoylglucosamine reductase n=1 Tax=Marivirga atlantica TaxID=1548457 RepID=A0A937AP76_9BACT|nr:UDP-N-acetylmuramate dehydrogenase [Marivirga atlantica]MBL0766302.1 UDP-N-acetylmuramate dehydrogenase [Marivirga atlantica]